MIYREGAAGSLYAMHDKSERRLVLTRISTLWSQVLFRAIQARQRKSKLFCCLFFLWERPPCLKRLCMFFFSFCIFFLFNPLWVHVALYLFCLPAYGRRKCASVTDRKLFSPGNLSVLVGVGGGVPAVFHLNFPVWHDSYGMYVYGMFYFLPGWIIAPCISACLHSVCTDASCA